MELADTSAWVWSRRSDQPQLRNTFDEKVASGKIATCDMVRLEILYSARNVKDFEALQEELEALDDCPVNKPEWERAVFVYHELAAKGALHQRSVKFQDLLIAAAAETASVAVLHYDQDYDDIASITGQPVVWLAPKGTII